MATFRSTSLALLGALAMFVGGCASVPLTTKPQTNQQPAPASTPASAANQAPTTAQQSGAGVSARGGEVVTTRTKVLGDFPTSKAKAVGKNWDIMHRDGFTGGYQSACGLLGLTAAQCKLYQEKHNAGSCVVMQGADGIVLDRLTFTKDGKHLVQHSVKVALKEPPTRTVEVCDLGGGVIAMRWHGCNNHALVTGWKKPLFTEVVMQSGAPATTSTACTEPAWMQINVWDSRALNVPGVRATIEETRPAPGSYYVANRVSRAHGGTFRTLHAKGELARSALIHPATIYLVKKDSSESVIDTGNVVGQKRIPMPAGFAEGDFIKVLFAGEQGLVSPISGDLRAQFKEFHPCGTHLHAIESAAR